MRNKNAHTKYRQFRRKFPRLKVISYDIDEIWSIDVAYVDMLAKYNHGVKYLLVAVDVLSRKLRVEPTCINQRNQITQSDQSTNQLILYTMTSQEFILIPKENYVKQKPKTLEILDDATINEKAKILSLLQRQQNSSETVESDEKMDKKPQWSPLQKEIIEKRVLKSLPMMKPGQIEKSKPILRKIYDSDKVSISEDGFLKIGDRETSIEATNFLYNLQQPKTHLHDPDYKKILDKIDISPHLIPNSTAKSYLQTASGKKRVGISTRKNKTPKKRRLTSIPSDDGSSIDDPEEEKSSTRRWDHI